MSSSAACSSGSMLGAAVADLARDDLLDRGDGGDPAVLVAFGEQAARSGRPSGGDARARASLAVRTSSRNAHATEGTEASVLR